MGIVRASGLLLAFATCFSAQAVEKKIPVVNESQIGDWWGISAGSGLVAPAYPAAYVNGKAEVCMAVGYLLNADGTTSNFGVLKSWSAAEPKRGRDAYWQAFANEAASALSQWRFVPKPGSGDPQQVYTVATFLFAPADAGELAKHCAIPSLVEHIVALGGNSRVRLRMSGSDIFSRLDVSPSKELVHTSRESEARFRQTESFNQQRLRAAPQSPPASGGGNSGGGGNGNGKGG